MDQRSSASNLLTASPTAVNWMVTVTESLPDCPSVQAGWEKIATQSKWGTWRSASKMRGQGIVTRVLPPATEPLQAGDEYLVKVGRFLTIRCHVVESSVPGDAADEHEKMVFDAIGVALGGIVKARFRFSLFRDEGGMVVAQAQERIVSLPCFVPAAKTLENEHRHTFRDLNKSFLPQPR